MILKEPEVGLESTKVSRGFHDLSLGGLLVSARVAREAEHYQAPGRGAAAARSQGVLPQRRASERSHPLGEQLLARRGPGAQAALPVRSAAATRSAGSAGTRRGCRRRGPPLFLLMEKKRSEASGILQNLTEGVHGISRLVFMRPFL